MPLHPVRSSSIRPRSGRGLRAALVAALTPLVLLGGMLVVAAPGAAAVPNAALISYGDRGPRVEKIQRFLRLTPVDGWFGPMTRHAVRTWKHSHHRGDNGWVGRKMLRIADRALERRREDNDGLNWAALAQCESGGNPRAINPAGPYYGLYQFDLSTWRSVGGNGYPHHAKPRHQTHRAKLLFRARGDAPWPVCGYLLYS